MGQEPRAEKREYRCPRCDHRSEDPVSCPRCGVVYAKVRDPRLGAALRERAVGSRVQRIDASQRFPYRGLKLYLLALPVAGLVDILLVALILPRYLLEWVAVFFHELGHALFHWLSSRAATPLALGPFSGWTSGELEQSVWVGICVVFLIGVLAYYGIRHSTWGLVVFASLLLLAWLYFTFTVDDASWEAVMIVGGLGGEPVIGALCVIGFYYRLPDRVRWDFFRFIFLGLGLYVYVRSAWMWGRIATGSMPLPYGTGLYGSSDAHGDIDRLRWVHDWSEQRIIKTYLVIIVVTGLVILGHYLFFAHREWSRPGRRGGRRPIGV